MVLRPVSGPGGSRRATAPAAIVQGTIHKWVVIVEVRAFQLGRLEGV